MSAEPDVVGIQEGDKFSVRVTNPQIPAGAGSLVAAVRVLQVPHPVRVIGHPTGRDLRTAITGPVVHQQQLPVGIGLAEHTLNRLLEISLNVEARCDDRNQSGLVHLVNAD
jgi:hypothetical protein